MSYLRSDLELASAPRSRFQRVLHHARAPASLPALFWKNIRYAIASRRPEFWSEQGRHLAARGRHEQALACYDRALAIRGDIPQVLTHRGEALRNLDRLDEAEASVRQALRRKPDFVAAYRELGRVLDCLGRFEEAEVSLRTALRLQPEDAVAHATLGSVLYNLGRATESQDSVRTALRLEPEHQEWRVTLAHALLLAGQLEEGWNEFEWRWLAKESKLRPLSGMPSWNGEPIGDRAILLLADQGHGDALQFCRYVPQIAAGARRTVLGVHPSLVRLLSRLPGVSEVITDGGRPSSPPDLWCGLMSLPQRVGTTLETIPSTTPYLTADPADVAQWRERLAGLKGLRVGLSWAGGQFNVGQIQRDRRRSVTLDTLAPLAEIPGVQFISLQKGPPAAQAARPPPGMELHDLSEEQRDFADTAAIVENLDLVISVDTAVAHLVGALGKPVWLLNHFDTDWRWLQNRDDSPWYPTLRQFRQPVPGDWNSAICAARDALQRLMTENCDCGLLC